MKTTQLPPGHGPPTGRKEGSEGASRPHAEPRERREGEGPAPPGGRRGAGRSLHLPPRRGGWSRDRSARRREGTRGSGQHAPARGSKPSAPSDPAAAPAPGHPSRPQRARHPPDPGRTAAGRARAGPRSREAREAGRGGRRLRSTRERRRVSVPRSVSAKGMPPALTCPLAPSRSGTGATLQPTHRPPQPSPRRRQRRLPDGRGGTAARDGPAAAAQSGSAHPRAPPRTATATTHWPAAERMGAVPPPYHFARVPPQPLGLPAPEA
ncbi:proline-rich protein 2-like [Saccopteryx leptura]|uniref:proline-rich protein 2-like n=1 Tax=Saccopteryx leptura TaxID=249018 RepID=UPI00339BF1B0